MDDRYYIDETCSVCGTECGSRLCDDCKAETELLFKALCLENFNPDQLIYLDNRLEGLSMVNYVKG